MIMQKKGGKDEDEDENDDDDDDKWKIIGRKILLCF